MTGGSAQPRQETDLCMWIQDYLAGEMGRVGELVCLQHCRRG